MSIEYQQRCKDLSHVFPATIQPVRSTFFYQVSTFIVAVLMICLPLVYLGMIGGAAYGVYWYAINETQILDAGRGRGKIIAIVLGYFAPLIAGSTLVIFMIKPLFAPQGKHEEPHSVGEKEEPLLHAFVDELCVAVGSPKPKRIDLVCEVNASASFRRGWLSMLGNDLVLTIGLPLVSCMSLRQLTGVLAHEFGHFSQGFGMRASYVIGSVNHWFARVVYQRDALDEKLDEAAQQSGDVHWLLMLVLWITKLCIWVSRRILWILMMIGHLCSSILSRQMEFDADRHAYRVVGTGAFSSALKELPIIAAAEQGAYQDLGQAYSEQRLVDDMPALIQANALSLPKQARQQLVEHGMTSNTGMYDSHPATKDRIRTAEQTDGIFNVDGPASQLFRDYAHLSKSVTLNYYRDRIGLNMRSLQLVDTTDVVADVKQREVGAESVQRYFCGVWMYKPFLQLKELKIKGEVTLGALKKALVKSHQEFLATRDDLIFDSKAFGVLDDKKDKEFANKPPRGRGKDMFENLGEEPSSWQRSYERLEKHGTVLNKRLQLARLIYESQPDLAPNVKGEQIKQCFDALICLKAAEEKLFILREYMMQFNKIIERLQADSENASHYRAMENCMGHTAGALKDLKSALGDTPYPFDHRRDDAALGHYVVNARVPRNDPQATFELGASAIDRSFGLVTRIMISLGLFAETIDVACGLPLLPKYEEESETADAAG